jgi:hypothetical protein
MGTKIVLQHNRGPKADTELSAFAPWWRFAADAEVFGFSAEGYGLEPFGR